MTRGRQRGFRESSLARLRAPIEWFRRPRVRRASKVIAITLGALLIAYWVIVNAILRFGGIEWAISSGTKDAKLTLGPSHSLIPGRIELENLTIRFEDQNVQFLLVVPKGTAKLGFLDLLKKRIHVKSLKADGIRFLFRHKVVAVAGNERRLPHFPRIEGFADPPIIKVEPPSDKSKNWGFLIENVEATAAELWFMEYRYLGRTLVRGSFELAPGRKLWVNPARLEFVSGTVSLGKSQPLATGVRGEINARFREANPDPIPGLLIFRQISSKVALDFQLVDFAAANLYLDEKSGMSVAGGRGSMRARLEVADGRFLPGMVVAYAPAEKIRIAARDQHVAALLELELAVREQKPDPPRVVITSSAKTLTASWGVAANQKTKQEGADASVRRADLRITLDNADVTKPWMLRELDFDLPEAFVEDLRSLNRLEALRAEKPLRSGSVWARAKARLAPEGKWDGTLRIDFRRVGSSVGPKDMLLRGSLAVAAEAPERSGKAGSLRDVRLELEQEPSEDSKSERTFRAQARSPRIVWNGWPPLGGGGDVNVRLESMMPVLKVLGAPGIVRTLWPDGPLVAKGSFRTTPLVTDLVLEEAKSNDFDARGQLRLGALGRRGAFLIESGVFSVGIAVEKDGIRIVPLAGKNWLEEQKR